MRTCGTYESIFNISMESCRFSCMLIRLQKIDSRTQLVDVSPTLNFKENVIMGTDIFLGKPDKLLGSDL